MAFFGGGVSLRDLVGSATLVMTAQDMIQRGQKTAPSAMPGGLELELVTEEPDG